MNIVLDTNVVISGLLWGGPAYRIFKLAREGKFTFYSSPALLAEFEDVLNRKKFLKKLKEAQVLARDLTLGYAALSKVILPKKISPVILEDPKDDEVLACALAAKADFIISGDSHLKDLKKYQEIPILSAAAFLEELKK